MTDISPVTKTFLRGVLVAAPVAAIVWKLATHSQESLPLTARFDGAVETLTSLAFVASFLVVTFISAVRTMGRRKPDRSKPTLD